MKKIITLTILIIPILGFQNCGQNALSIADNGSSKIVSPIGGAQDFESPQPINDESEIPSSQIEPNGIFSDYSIISYYRFGYDPINNSHQSYNSNAIKVDLTNQNIYYSAGPYTTGLPSRCNLSDDKAIRIKNILHGAKICHPLPPLPGTVTCMAMPLVDIRLYKKSDDREPIELSKLLCNQGAVLCGDKDLQFRQVLSELLDAQGNCN